MEKYRINKKQLLIKICIVMLFAVSNISFFIWLAVSNTPDISKDKDALIFFIGAIGLLNCIFCFYPTFVVLTQYNFEKNVVLSFDKKAGNCIYTKDNKSIKFNITDIKYAYYYRGIKTFYGELK
ncbi:MAG: hypothetical protein LBN95_12460 [Prevotellaceae bacterium]|jgi:hypothetical protein|nr:hypothetical protein [Prevotellaceae bacterium]